jgi:hypothetical protein
MIMTLFFEVCITLYFTFVYNRNNVVHGIKYDNIYEILLFFHIT